MGEQISKTRELYDIPRRENNRQITRLREGNGGERILENETVSDSEF